MLNPRHKLSMSGGIKIRMVILNKSVDNDSKEIGTQIGMIAVRLRCDVDESRKVSGENGVS